MRQDTRRNSLTGGSATRAGRRRCGLRGRLRLPRRPMPPLHGYGPSCFFPARAAGVLLAPAAAALLALWAMVLASPLAHAAAPEDRAWPVAGPSGLGPTVLRGWEPPPSPWAAGHRGVDLASSAGATVRSAAPGRVAFAGTVAGRGVLTIEVSRSGRPSLRTTYEPVRPTARKGQRVAAGQPVAVVQRGPFHCRGPCLHWGLRRGATYLDPLSLLPRSMRGGGPSRLLPVFGVPLPPGGRTVPRRPGPPEPAAQVGRPTPSGAALIGAVCLAAAALWAIGRLTPGRPAGRGGAAGARPGPAGEGGGGGPGPGRPGVRCGRPRGAPSQPRPP
ncbi:murein hydrolase activator EnvC family protein [Streptomyces sp. NPDC002446]